jgi:hypothetical protein
MKKLIPIICLLATTALAADFVVYPFTLTTNNCFTGTGCPGGYCGYATYKKAAANGFRWAIDTSVMPHTATYTNNSSTKMECIDRFGADLRCSLTNTITTTNSPSAGDKYSFIVFFTNSIPETNGLLLHGFLP